MAEISIASLQIQEWLDTLKLRREERAEAALTIQESLRTRGANFQERLERQAEIQRQREETEIERRDFEDQRRTQILETELQHLRDVDLTDAARQLQELNPDVPRGSTLDITV